MGQRPSVWKTGFVCAMVLGGVTMTTESYGFGPPQGGGQGGGFLRDLMARVDTDKDGTVTQQEMEEFHKQRFSSADANGDGQLSKEEFLTAESRDEVRRQTRQSRMADMFSTLDKDGNGTLTQDEALTMATDRFKKLDTNGDGKITQEEMQTKRRFGPR